MHSCTVCDTNSQVIPLGDKKEGRTRYYARETLSAASGAIFAETGSVIHVRSATLMTKDTEIVEKRRKPLFTVATVDHFKIKKG